MTKLSLIPMAAAALIIAVAGPAMAKKQKADQVYTTQQVKKKSKQQTGENCFLQAPPFMRNPRFMNRGFFKKTCPGQN